MWVKARSADRVMRQATGYPGSLGGSASGLRYPVRISHQIGDEDASGFEPQRGRTDKAQAKGLGLQIEER